MRGKFGMKISASKSKRMVYGKIKVVVEDRDEQSVMEMEEVETFKYLGIVLALIYYCTNINVLPITSRIPRCIDVNLN